MRRGIIPRHTLSGIELAPRIVTAEQYEQQNKGMVSVTDDTVRMLAGGITASGKDRNGRYYTRVMPGLGISPMAAAHYGTADQGSPGRSEEPNFRQRPDGARYLHLCWQARERPGAGALEAPQGRRVPGHPRARHGVGHGRGATRRPALPGPSGTPYMPYGAAANRFGRMLDHLGIAGVHTHSLRHQSQARPWTPTPASWRTSPRFSATTASRPRCGSTSTPAPTPSSASAR